MLRCPSKQRPSSASAGKLNRIENVVIALFMGGARPAGRTQGTGRGERATLRFFVEDICSEAIT